MPEMATQNRTIRTLSIVSVLVGFNLFTPNAQAGAIFSGIGFLSGHSLDSAALGVSDDGRVLVGFSGGLGADERFAIRWTLATGLIPVAAGPDAQAWGVSADGSVIVGGHNTLNGHEAFRWTAGTGVVDLGDLPGGRFYSHAYGVSNDGRIVVGQSSSGFSPDEAFLWSVDAGFFGLGDLPGAGVFSAARGVSADGRAVVGATHSSNAVPEAFLWTETGGMVGLGDLPGGDAQSSATAISGDGLVVVGDSFSGRGNSEAFRWTAASGMLGLGFLPSSSPNANPESYALAVSHSGETIVGYDVTSDGPRAFIWSELTGMRSVESLATDLGLDVSGWTLTHATGVSADGQTIVGYGINADGNREGWIIQADSTSAIPEPSSLVLLAIGSLALLGIRRGRQFAIAA